jgi:hypothetical protein
MNYYERLGVSSSATKEEIKRAFRVKSKVHHPDVGGSNVDFILLMNAYQTLSDDYKRKLYDEKTFGKQEEQRDHTKEPEPDRKNDDLGVVEFQPVTFPQSLIKKHWDWCYGVGSILIAFGVFMIIVDTLLSPPTVAQVNAVNTQTTSQGTPSTTNIQPSTEQPGFTVGTSKEDVQLIMGPPDSVRTVTNASVYYEEWLYGLSTVDFDQNDEVVIWNNNDGNLKLKFKTNQ